MAQKTQKDYQEIFLKYQELSTQNIPEATLFIGYSSSGKTTLLQLIKKFIANQHDENLKINEKGIYQYQNVINQKSLKIGTINPAIYQIKQQSFVDVPVLIYQAEPKKWNSIDQAVTLGGVFQCFKKVRFVILIQQKFTQTKINIWKKALDNIIQYMDQNKLNQEIFNAFSFIITKCTKVNQTAGINRLESLLELLVKESSPQKAKIYNQIISNIKENKRLQVFKKTALDEDQNKKNVEEIYKDICKYPFCSINPDLLTEKIKVEEVGRALLNQQCNNQLKNILKFWGQSLTWLFRNKNYQKLEEFQLQKKKNYLPIDVYQNLNKNVLQHQNFSFQISYQKSLKNKNTFTNIVSASQLFFDILNFLTPQQGQKIHFVKSFINILEKYGLILDNQDEINIHKMLLQFSIFEEIVGNVIQWDFFQYFQECFKECKDQNLKKFMRSYFLDDSYKLEQSQQYYQNILEILNKYFNGKAPTQKEEKEKYQNILISCEMAVFDEKQYQKSLKQLFSTFSQYKQKFEMDSNLLAQFYAKLGKLLMMANQDIKAAKILKNGGHLGLAMQAYEKSVSNKYLNNEKDVMDYIQLLFQMFLKEEAKKICFKLAHMITSNQNRKKMEMIIKDEYKSPQKMQYINIFFRKQNPKKLSREEETQLKMLIDNLQT